MWGESVGQPRRGWLRLSKLPGLAFRLYQLYADHQAEAADFSYEWVVLLQCAEFGHGVIAGRWRGLGDFLFIIPISPSPSD